MKRSKRSKQQGNFRDIAMNEIPLLKMQWSTSTADFVTNNVELISRGFTHHEAVEGMKVLLHELDRRGKG